MNAVVGPTAVIGMPTVPILLAATDVRVLPGTLEMVSLADSRSPNYSPAVSLSHPYDGCRNMSLSFLTVQDVPDSTTRTGTRRTTGTRATTRRTPGTRRTTRRRGRRGGFAAVGPQLCIPQLIEVGDETTGTRGTTRRTTKTGTRRTTRRTTTGTRRTTRK